MTLPGSITAGVEETAAADGAFVNEEEGVVSVEPARVKSEPGKGVAHFTQRAALA